MRRARPPTRPERIAPTSAPVVVKVASFDACPTAIATTANVFAPHNFPDKDDDRHAHPAAGFRALALVGTEDGTLHVLDVGGLHDDAPADASAVHEVSRVTVGRNPTSIVTLGRTMATFGSPVDYAVVSRGDRRVDLLPARRRRARSRSGTNASSTR